ncbi:right-handed parallel beta-helix repeat-containing protein, partial [Thermogutta sp.]|uniref:right-handed parallel beta-helix repeat-containing protein n=1 Tax=Thermogutta sp. TaxID=1962930 RepID=UPI003C797A1D
FERAGGTARNNVCRNNGLHGILLRNEAKPTLEGNTCEGNQGSGIAYYDHAGGTARKNVCRGNRWCQIEKSEGANPILEDNDALPDWLRWLLGR